MHEKNAKIWTLLENGTLNWSHGYSTSPVDPNLCKTNDSKPFDMFEISEGTSTPPKKIVEAPKAPEKVIPVIEKASTKGIWEDKVVDYED